MMLTRLLRCKRAFSAAARGSPFADTLAPKYDPRDVETGVYQWWQQQGLFTADPNSTKPKFSMILPPPNVTGSLHIGHALTCSIQDAIARYKRMTGNEVVWVPGQDHAGIATQVVVEKKLLKERGLSRHDLGRDAFLQEVHAWKQQYGSRISEQLQRMGASLDWSRDFFTMDASRSEAVTEAFVRLHKTGMLYRATRMVNWCPALKTAISDIEVDVEEITGPTDFKVLLASGSHIHAKMGLLYDIGYRIEGTDTILRVSTTRPETLLGDTALAVHPDDARYASLIGKFAVSPCHGRRIPVIADAVLVDPAFGTGVVKVTPAHSFDDFECGSRNGLASVNIMNDDGTINEAGAQIGAVGSHRFAAREMVISCLTEHGLYFGSKPHGMRVSRCSRTGDILEPLVKPQWFVRTRDFADRCVQAVKSGNMEVIPSEHADTWFRWLEGIHDWCISRQLWWGHRVPAYCIQTGEGEVPVTEDKRWVVAPTEQAAREQACSLLGHSRFTLQQDEDVLDTWFSSGLLPLSALGWPSATADLRAFYPLDVMETGSDILFFWVARMAMLCSFLDDANRMPFKRILLHPLVRDSQGRKMSKSLGNVIDPLHVMDGIGLEEMIHGLQTSNLDPKEVQKATKGLRKEYPDGIERCGTDALRLALVDYLRQGRQINMDVNRVVSARNFAQKLWQASRYALSHLPKNVQPYSDLLLNYPAALFSDESFLAEQWILVRLAKTTTSMRDAMESGQLADATEAVQNFFLHDFCDQYIEFSKKTLYSADSAKAQVVRDVLHTVLTHSVHLLHPFMPFITECIWYHVQQLTSSTSQSQSLMGSRFAVPHAEYDDVLNGGRVVERMDMLLDAIHAARGLRQTRSPKAEICMLEAATPVALSLLKQFAEQFASLTRFKSVEVLDQSQAQAVRGVIRRVAGPGITVLLPMGTAEANSDMARLNKKRAEVQAQLSGMADKMSMPGYETRVPVAIKEADRTRIELLNKELAAIDADVTELNSL